MLTVLTWLWRQPNGRTRYTAFHVNVWAAMVRRHLTLPHRIACVTREAEGLDPRIEVIDPPGDFEDVRIPTWGESLPQCLRRLAMFRPDAADIFGERFVCMDLDVVIGGGLDPLFDRREDFMICRGTSVSRPYNGSMLMMTAGARPQVYTEFTAEGAKEAGRRFVGSDQAWIAHKLGWGEATWGADEGVHWWLRGRLSGASPRILFFPGSAKPDAVSHPFVEQHYRGSDPRRCMILGYAPAVWKEAEIALKQQDFDVVIASPEAAAHWPEPVFAVANSDAEAERIAAMHGFETVVFCGRSERVAA